LIPGTRQYLCLVAMLALVCWADDAHAVNHHDQLSQYVRQQWTVEGDFPGGPVRTIMQTTDGYLWLGTQKGLIRFDGLNFRPNSSPRPLFQNDQISDLMKGPDGQLWVVFWGAGILRYRDGRFEGLASKFGQPGIQVTASLDTHNGSILLADGINGIERVGNDRTETLAPANALPGYALVSSMAESRSGTIWLGTASQGLFSLKDGEIHAVASGLAPQRINSLLPTGENSIWVGTGSGLFEWDGDRITRLPLPKEAAGAQILTMMRDHESNIWVGTTRGLLRFDRRGVSSFDQSSFASGGVTALFEDRESNIWVGGARGLQRLSQKTFVTYTRTEGLPGEINGPVDVDDAGRTWVAPQQGGVYVISDSSVQRVKSPFLNHNVIYSIAGHSGDLWLGTQNGGLVRATYKDGLVATKVYTHNNGLAENSVYSVSIGRDGAIWAGTLTGGVSRFAGGKFVTYTSKDGLASNTVSATVETRDGTIWFATPNGLSSLSAGQWSSYTTKDGLPSDIVNCLFEDKSGTLWVGTSAGLVLVEHGKIRALLDLPPSLRDQVFGFAQDLAGLLWVQTATHLLRIEPQRSSKSTVSSVKVREYDTEDGLPPIEGVRRNNSVASGTGGTIWFSLRNGVTMVDSANIPADSVAALAHVDILSADGKIIQLADSIRIPPSPQRITLEYTGISLTVPERVRFRFFLEGFDHVWSGPVATREAVYTNLGPGPYRFRVVASNSDGLWNGTETSIAFRVEPAFWQTVWFRTVVVALILLTFWVAFRIRTYQIKRQLDLRFQERLAERNRIAQELHDTLLQSMQGTILRFQSVDEMLPAYPDEAKQVLERSLQKADLALIEGRDAIMDIRSTSTAAFDLAEAIRSIITELSEQAGAAGNSGDFCVVMVSGTRRTLRLEVRDDVCRIAREALHNAMQHAQAKQIIAEITYSAVSLGLQILDNGKGMEPRVLEQGGRLGHWGLVGMRERAARIGGTLEIISGLDEGTKILLTLPGNLAFEPQRIRSRWWSPFSR
jgi:ligand-binding sensor domain-containing protein/signal transduction histidine kinase